MGVSFAARINVVVACPINKHRTITSIKNLEQSHMTSTTSPGKSWKKSVWFWPGVWLLVAASVFALVYYLLHINPLPKDEELIAQFQEHRADIEELARRYRQIDPQPNKDHSLWIKEGDTPALFKRAKVWSVQSAVGIWLPNPYSVESAKIIEEQSKTAKDLSLSVKYGTLHVQFDDPRYTGTALLYGNKVWKDLYFIPQIPRIENGVLLGPLYRGVNSPNYRVFNSLNEFPKDWGLAECVLRQIEPQWFIRMCRV